MKTADIINDLCLKNSIGFAFTLAELAIINVSKVTIKSILR